MHNRPTIWLTRPRADSIALAAELADHGIESIIAPVMHITPQPFSAPDSAPDAVLLTSRHAVQALAQLPASWHQVPVYTVGKATAHAAADCGFKTIIPGPSDVMALLPRIMADMGSGGELLYLSGEDISVNIAHHLAPHGIHVINCSVYRAVAETSITSPLRAALMAGSIHSVVFFSARSARITAELLTREGLADTARTIEAFCLSAAVASAARQVAWAALHTCHTPSRHAMCDLIVSHPVKTL